MEVINRARNPIRRQFDRLVKEIDEMLANDRIEIVPLRVSGELLDNLTVQLNDWDLKAKDALLDANANDVDIDKEYEEAEVYQRAFLRIKAARLELEGRGVANQTTDNMSTSTECKSRKYHLPEIKLRTFGGQLKNWLGWWSQFVKIHLDEDLHNTDKFHYLCQSMESGSEAAALVNSYPQTEENYPKAVRALQERFGRNDLLLQVYVRELLSLVISNVTSTDKMPLAKLYVSLESHLRSLAALKWDKADPATWLFPLVESSLFEETLRAWQRSDLSKRNGADENPPKSRLDMLMEFVKLEVQSDQHILLAQQGFKLANTTAVRKNVRKLKDNTDDIPTVAGLVAQQTGNCNLCEKPHATSSCVSTRIKPWKDRTKIIREKKLCFKCLRPGHRRAVCRSKVKCTGCGSSGHFFVLCFKNPKEQSTTDGDDKPKHAHKRRRIEHETDGSPKPKTSTSVHQASNQCSPTVLLNTIRAFVKTKQGQLIPIRILGDSGCQRSYATTNVMKNSVSKYLGHEWLQNIVFGGSTSAPLRVPKHNLFVYGSNGKHMEFQLLVREQLTGDIQEIPPGAWLNEFEEKGVVFGDMGDSASQADIVIGNNYWGNIRTGRMVKSASGLVAEETIFGWTLGGRATGFCESTQISNMMLNTEIVENLWKLEVLGIRDPHEKSKADEDVEAWEHFKKTVKRDKSGMYVVSLPWNNNKENLPTNKKVAVQRLKSTTSKLKREEKFGVYHQVFQNWEKEGLIVRVNECDNGHFIPHRPVFKDSATTPVRPVFDASCKIGNNPCLNECIHKGPNLIELIPIILLRFGMKRIGVSADIRKAFQMMRVLEDDQRYQRFVWWKDEKCTEMIIYQHDRVVFGVSCSPFLLGITIAHHLDNWNDKQIAESLKPSFYVDNLLTSVDTTAEFESFQAKSNEVMMDANMELREWAWTVVDGLPLPMKSNNMVSVLGLEWNREDDTMSCCIKPADVPNKLTKRYILSTMAQVFDPMGYLCPAMVFPKMMLQEVWAVKIGWDDEVPVTIQKKFTKWYNELGYLKNVKIPRFSQIVHPVSKEVHVFCDSSKEAMAAVAFLRSELYGEVNVQFMFAKSRVTPTKKLTIPRAELVGCVIGARVGKLIHDAGYIDVIIQYWSDSSTALAWIKRKGDWGVFVANRVKEIGSTTKSNQWRHVPGSKNPADLPSRGCSPESLVNSKWWEGPSWLKDTKDDACVWNMVTNEDEVQHEVKKSVALIVLPIPVKPRFSSYRKNVAVWAWVLRFIKNAKKSEAIKYSHVSLLEMRDAEKVVLRKIQTESFQPGINEIGGIRLESGTDGLLRVKTRLNYREDKSSFILPTILPNSHPMVDLLIVELHRFHGHAGIQFIIGKLREKYWILQTRKAVRRIVKRCVVCKRHSEKPLTVEPAPLPAKRVASGAVFTTVGVDLAGPLFLKDKQKAWIVLYTCAVYRAVHLDLVTSLSTEAFLRSLERFIGIYGRPNTLWSDN